MSNTTTRICRVCGKEYEYCRSVLKPGEIFRWQDVACSSECGEKYFKQIIESRREETLLDEAPTLTDKKSDTQRKSKKRK